MEKKITKMEETLRRRYLTNCRFKYEKGKFFKEETKYLTNEKEVLVFLNNTPNNRKTLFEISYLEELSDKEKERIKSKYESFKKRAEKYYVLKKEKKNKEKIKAIELATTLLKKEGFIISK